MQEKSDTVFAFRLDGKTILSHSPGIDLSHFQYFLDSCSSHPVSITNLALSDVTGDGMADSCLTKVSLVQNLPFIQHEIISNGRTIWLDTLTLQNSSVSTLYWNDDSAYANLMPYSGFFIAKVYFTNFIGKVIDPNELRSSYFVNVSHSDHRAEYIDRFSLFKGHRILKLDVSDPNELIWDNRANVFIMYSGN